MHLTIDDLIYLGVRGYVVALERNNGQEIWRTALKGYDFVNLVIDGNDLLATARGEIFCLDRATGQVRWNNPLRGMGYGIICIASPNAQAALAAESHSRAQAAAAHSSTTVTSNV
jgi:outer membrane protein assembly factor BamB